MENHPHDKLVVTRRCRKEGMSSVVKNLLWFGLGSKYGSGAFSVNFFCQLILDWTFIPLIMYTDLHPLFAVSAELSASWPPGYAWAQRTSWYRIQSVDGHLESPGPLLNFDRCVELAKVYTANFDVILCMLRLTYSLRALLILEGVKMLVSGRIVFLASRIGAHLDCHDNTDYNTSRAMTQGCRFALDYLHRGGLRTET